MALVGAIKGGMLSNAAELAWNQGREYFTPLLKFPLAKTDMYGAIVDWPPIIEAVEAIGWTLHTWAVTTDEKGLPQALPLFARRP